MVKVLAFDCAGARCAAGIVIGGRLAATRIEAMERGQAEALLPMIDDVVRAAGLRFAALDLIAVTVGPGSFTGLRIGVAAARGLALASGLPAIGIGSFDAVAAGVAAEERRGRPLAVVLESKRDELFLRCFAADGAPLGPAFMAAPQDAAAALIPGPLLLAGDAAWRLAPFLADRAALADSAALPALDDVAGLALAAWRPGERPSPPRPVYLRAPDTTLPRASRAAARAAG